MRGFSVAGL